MNIFWKSVLAAALSGAISGCFSSEGFSPERIFTAAVIGVAAYLTKSPIDAEKKTKSGK